MDLRRTDLAMEARELWQERAGQTAQLPGVRAEERKRAGMPVTVVQVLDERGEQALGKPRGTYVRRSGKKGRISQLKVPESRCRAVPVTAHAPGGETAVLLRCRTFFICLGNRKAAVRRTDSR